MAAHRDGTIHTVRGRTIPRLRHAARLYASGACRTKKEAAEAVGVNPSYFNIATQPGHAKAKPELIAIMDDIERAIQDKTVALSSVIEGVSREALTEMRSLLKNSKNEAIRLKAASDVLDRNPETSKTQKHQLSSFSLNGEDAKQLAAALVKSAEAQRRYAGQLDGDYIRIPQDSNDPPQIGEINAGQLTHSTELRSADLGIAERAVERILESAEGSGDLSAGEAREGPAPQEPARQGPLAPAAMQPKGLAEGYLRQPQGGEVDAP